VSICSIYFDHFVECQWVRPAEQVCRTPCQLLPSGLDM